MANGVSRAVIEVLLDRVNQGAGTLSPEGQLTYANQRLASMLGHSRAQLVGKPLTELFAEADRDALATALAAGRDSAAQCRLELKRANGAAHPALLTFAPLGHGQASFLITDLTDARQRDSADERSGRFLVMLAHEVRNMLGAIRTSVEVLKRSAHDADGQRALDAIERQSGRILELMEELRRVNPNE